MDTGSSPGVFLFEQFRFDPRSGGLSRRTEDGEFRPVSLGSRAIAVLGVLVARAGDLVAKDDLMRAVWPGMTVGDANLTMHISALRRVLDADRSGNSCILNVPGRGYRFLPKLRSGPNLKLVALAHLHMVGHDAAKCDDSGTQYQLRTLRQELIEPVVVEHGGRIVEATGRALLIIFDSIDRAIRCVVKVQHLVALRDGGAGADERPGLRVGMDICDAVADGAELVGDGVDIAIELQKACPVGGICVSRSVRDHVDAGLNLSFEALEPISLKNINEPVDAFVLRPGNVNAAKAAVLKLPPDTVAALPLPDKPSIAVLAFTNMGGDPEQEYFSDGVTGSIITALSRLRWLFVVARNSSFIYKGRPVDVRQVAQQLGVRYVLEGSVQRRDERVRVNVQLIDAAVGTHIWADRYDRRLADVFVVQDEITDAVSRAIGTAISRAEQQRAIRKPSENLDAWEAYQRALWHHGKGGPTDVQQARFFLERAIQLDPLFAAPHAMLAFTSIYTGNIGAPLALPDALAMVRTEARTAIELDPDEPGALVAMAWMAWSEGDHAAAVQHAEQAISVDPNHSGAYLVKGMALAYSGRTSEGREAGMIARRLSPHDPMSVIMRLLMIVSYYFERDYVNALTAASSATRDYVSYPTPYRYVAASLGQLGRSREAREALQLAVTVAPADFDSYVRSRRPWFRPQDYEHVLAGLRNAGWQG